MPWLVEFFCGWHDVGLGRIMKSSPPKDPFVCPKKKDFPSHQSYDLKMGCFDHQSYEKSEGVWILMALLESV